MSFAQALTQQHHPSYILPEPTICNISWSVSLNVEAHQASLQRQALSLVGKFAGRRPSIKAMERYVLASWRTKLPVTIGLGPNGCFRFGFKRFDDLLEILQAAPWSLADNVLRLKRWDAQFDPKADFPTLYLIWVQLHNASFDLFSPDLLFSIGKAIGKPLRIDEYTLALKRLTYARICIELNPALELPRHIEVITSAGTQTIAVEPFPCTTPKWTLSSNPHLGPTPLDKELTSLPDSILASVTPFLDNPSSFLPSLTNHRLSFDDWERTPTPPHLSTPFLAHASTPATPTTSSILGPLPVTTPHIALLLPSFPCQSSVPAPLSSDSDHSPTLKALKTSLDSNAHSGDVHLPIALGSLDHNTLSGADSHAEGISPLTTPPSTINRSNSRDSLDTNPDSGVQRRTTLATRDGRDSLDTNPDSGVQRRTAQNIENGRYSLDTGLDSGVLQRDPVANSLDTNPPSGIATPHAIPVSLDTDTPSGDGQNQALTSTSGSSSSADPSFTIVPPKRSTKHHHPKHLKSHGTGVHTRRRAGLQH
ncbi:hypothetical protein QJS10_CPB22g00004 [Acorus calamus]|uniref:DUF4283 domain-containing protein n=1 Tax=Acorus calamus TaxID=4465 RepID=A0AAV9BZW7_ACOCL|nr:hypothetical protein QJS10_CPB22g00004 [Acorus calamus]